MSAVLIAILTAVASVVAIFGGVVTILRAQRTTRREDQADAEARTNTIVGKIDSYEETANQRFVKLEGAVAGFVPGDKIDEKIQHVRGNLDLKVDALDRRLGTLGDRVSRQDTDLARIAERHDGLAASFAKIERLVEEGFKGVESKLDRMREIRP